MRLHWYTIAFVTFLFGCLTYKIIIQIINSSPTRSFPKRKNLVIVHEIYKNGFNHVNSDICLNNGKDLAVFIAVLSTPEHEARRQAIRNTWGNFVTRTDVSIGFFIGTPTNNDTIDNLMAEDWMYKDLIRCKSIDNNRTLKTLHMLEWTKSFCSEAKFLLKTEDEAFVNVVRVLELLSNLNQWRKAIYGRIVRNLVPMRNKYHADYVSLEEYLPKIYPDFATGPTYLIPTWLSGDLFSRGLHHAYLRLEDVFLTGTVANNLAIERVDFSSLFNVRLPATGCNIRRSISMNILNEKELYDIWLTAYNNSISCK